GVVAVGPRLGPVGRGTRDEAAVDEHGRAAARRLELDTPGAPQAVEAALAPERARERGGEVAHVAGLLETLRRRQRQHAALEWLEEEPGLGGQAPRDALDDRGVLVVGDGPRAG